jgi:hypothetical protein
MSFPMVNAKYRGKDFLSQGHMNNRELWKFSLPERVGHVELLWINPCTSPLPSSRCHDSSSKMQRITSTEMWGNRGDRVCLGAPIGNSDALVV